MRVPKINFLEPQSEKRRKKIKTLIKISSAFIVILVIFFCGVSFLASYALPWQSAEKPTVFERMTTLLPARERKLIGEKEDRINVLLLGMGGAGHDGPYLTDTIMLVSFQPSQKKAVLLSVPRDLVVPINDYGWRKINHINAFAEVENPGQGGEQTRKILSDVLNIPIPYYVRIDFNGFKKIIDDLGGIAVNVERAFVDTLYPTADFKTKTVSFPAGWQVMDGEKALQFVRSRHGNNNEGNDFARSKRQQKMILAIKDKIFSINTILSPLRLIEAMQTMKNHIDTNFEVWEITRAANLITGLNNDNVLNYVLDDSEKGLLQAEVYEGAYVLLPRNGWGQLKYFIQNVFTEISQAQITLNKLKDTKIEVQNGTKIPGLAALTADKLGKEGLNVIFYGNAQKQDYDKTLIINLTNQNEKEALQKISGIIGGEIINKKNLPKDINPTTNTQGAEILIILGTDQKL